MEFEGRISRVLPVRSGVSQRTGNEWKALPFVFEYFERQDDRYPDRVLLETFDTNIMAQIGAYCQKDAAGKVIVENGETKMIRDIPCRVGFGHSVRSGQKQDGTTFHMNDVRLYKFELANGQQQQPAGNAAGTVAQQPAQQMQQQAAPFGQQGAAPFPPQVDANGNPTYDDLPF